MSISLQVNCVKPAVYYWLCSHLQQHLALHRKGPGQRYVRKCNILNLIPFLRDLISLGMWVAGFLGFVCVSLLFLKKLTQSFKVHEQRYHTNCIQVHHLSCFFTSSFWDRKSSLILAYGFEFCLVILRLFAYFCIIDAPSSECLNLF